MTQELNQLVTDNDEARITLLMFQKSTEEIVNLNKNETVIQNIERDSDEFATIYLGQTNNSHDEHVPYLVLNQDAINAIAKFRSGKQLWVDSNAFKNIVEQFRQACDADELTNTTLDCLVDFAEASEFFEDKFE